MRAAGVNRKILIAALGGAAVLAVGAASYFLLDARKAGTRQPALWLPAEAPTRPDWIARVTPLADGFSGPFGAAVDLDGNLYVSEGGAGNRIRRIGPDGRVVTFAGTHAGFADGPAADAAFDMPSSLAIDRLGNLLVADTGNNAIRKITPDGRVSTLAGGLAGYLDGLGGAARFDGPVGVAVDRAGNVYVADTYNDRIRRIDKTGAVTTVAGHGLLHRPVALALTHDGMLYVGGAGGRIVQIDPHGPYHALLDAERPPQTSFGSDGSVRLVAPRGIALKRDGTLVVADGAASQVFALAPQVVAAQALPTALPTTSPAPPMPWPVAPQHEPHEIVGVMGEVRGSYGGESRDHFHAGLDIRADIGTRVLAIAPATVSDPYPNWDFGDLGEGMSLGPLSYIHMCVGRDGAGHALDARFQLLLDPRGKPMRVRVRRGARFAVGDALGTVNPMAHVHMEYRPGGLLANPLMLGFTGLRDTVAPHIQGIALYDSSGQRLPVRKGRRVQVARALGEVAIVADGYDQMDGNLARRRLGLYKLGYQLLHADGSPVAGFETARITQVYDRLPRERAAVKLVYADSSGITVYGSKTTRFAYAVNNTLQGGLALAGSWKVGDLAPGDYLLRIYAADYAGQVAVTGRDLAITVE